MRQIHRFRRFALQWCSQCSSIESWQPEPAISICARCCFTASTKLLRLIIIILGWYQLIALILSILDAVSPDSALSVIASKIVDSTTYEDSSSSPDAIHPILCHSHNDYWRVKPLFSALDMGCSSIEADVWVNRGDLLVGHSWSSLVDTRTLESTYLQPILDRLITQNAASKAHERVGVFPSHPDSSLVLLVDFKEDSELIWPLLYRQLEPLRAHDFLTFFNGTDVIKRPITIVVSGKASLKDIVRNSTHRDIFFDAPLGLIGGQSIAPLHIDDGIVETSTHMTSGVSSTPLSPINAAVYSPANSYFASASFMHTIGYPMRSTLSRSQLELLRAHIREAHERGLKVRYWDTPTWPIGIRNYVWRVLVREGADYLSVDDIKAVAQRDWGPRKGGWNRKWWA